MKNEFFGCLFSAVLATGIMAVGCASRPATLVAVKTAAVTPDLTGVTSYYVRANGNDRNAGTSENAPFKTLSRAVEAAANATVKKITVIGTLVENTEIVNADQSIRLPKRIINDDDGKKLGVVTIDWPLDQEDPDEILITGKPGVSVAEKAILKPVADNASILTILASTIRLEHIEISGLNSKNNSCAVTIIGGTLTLANDAKITKNISNDIAGFHAFVSVIISVCL